jgi:hypothetical protein
MKQKLDVKHSDPHHDAITCPCMALVLYIFTGFRRMKTKIGCKNYKSYLHQDAFTMYVGPLFFAFTGPGIS